MNQYFISIAILSLIIMHVSFYGIQGAFIPQRFVQESWPKDLNFPADQIVSRRMTFQNQVINQISFRMNRIFPRVLTKY